MSTGTEARTPLFVHCRTCKHEWAPVLLPIEVGIMATILKSTRCPSCGSASKDHALGRTPRRTPPGDAHAWLHGGDTGMSSETIWRVLMGETPRHPRTPSDPSDFGRCYRLLRLMPGWRQRLGEVAAVYREWTALVAAWDELTAIYEEELPSGQCPRLYARMKELGL
jgi:hypothetical protein